MQENFEIINFFEDVKPGTVFEWNDNAMNPDKPFGDAWVDVYVPEICDKIGWSWLVTIDDEASDGIDAPRDAFIDMLLPNGEYGLPAKIQYRVDDNVQPVSKNYYDPDKATEDTKDSWVSTQTSRLAEKHEIEGKTWVSFPVWSPEAISESISSWIHSLTGKRHSFSWNPEIGLNPIAAEAAEILEDIKAGHFETVALEELDSMIASNIEPND